jgi:hypothetical protein
MGSGDGITKSITDFLARLTKEPAGEVGGMLADRVRYWRLKQAVGFTLKCVCCIQCPA